MIEEFSVAQFLVDGTYEYIARRVGAEEAVRAANSPPNRLAPKPASSRKRN